MSERWGNCGSCGGKGHKLEVVHEGRSATGFVVTTYPAGIAEAQTFDGPHVIAVAKGVECGMCGGTGHSGDINDYQG